MAHKILIVEDERISASIVRFGLVEQRYDVIEASNGREGLQKVKEEDPDLIVLDIMMPEMSGYEFLAELKVLQGGETTPVIVLTGNEMLEDVFKLEGVKDYIVKPVDIPRLVDRIKSILGENVL